ncbi:hypothetical protein GCM10007901_00620 [Dyella acidisoli]|uniref:Uncharacterized protein n=1 Tax=Dyella acidisoli TaxID=1867834 RepID=A0ABQ5XJI8_9GAMM|nr:hypothetical protein GCM10007901_00620 [Dyella acidisoli]
MWYSPAGGAVIAGVAGGADASAAQDVVPYMPSKMVTALTANGLKAARRE